MRPLIHLIHADSQTVNQRPDLRKRDLDSRTPLGVNQPLTCGNARIGPQKGVNHDTPVNQPKTAPDLQKRTMVHALIHESPLTGRGVRESPLRPGVRPGHPGRPRSQAPSTPTHHERNTMRIIVHGTPAPQGSKRHVGNGVMIESSKKVKPWREAVKWAALDAFSILLDECPALADDSICSEPGHIGWTQDGPVAVQVTFYLPRPQGHYGTGRNATTLKPSAPARPWTKPDLDKLLRSTLDALGEAGLWADDSRVAVVLAEKQYADHRPPGAVIDVTRADLMDPTTTEETR